MTGIDAALWDEALRLLREKGDPQLLGALLWRATPDGEGNDTNPDTCRVRACRDIRYIEYSDGGAT